MPEMGNVLHVMVGISGCGKSTYAKSLADSTNSVIVETDGIRKELTGNESDQSVNDLVFKIARNRVDEQLKKGNCIIDATNLTPWERKSWVEIASKNNCAISAYVFNVDVEIAKARNSQRSRQVPEHVIEKQSKKFVIPTRSEGFQLVVRV